MEAIPSFEILALWHGSPAFVLTSWIGGAKLKTLRVEKKNWLGKWGGCSELLPEQSGVAFTLHVWTVDIFCFGRCFFSNICFH